MEDSFLNRMAIQEGDFVFREGAEGDQAYIVQDGAVEIFKDAGGREYHLGTVRKGGIFGEMALIDDEPRMATARAVTPTTLIIIGRKTFSDKLGRCDPFMVGLVKILVNNVRSMAQVMAAE